MAKEWASPVEAGCFQIDYYGVEYAPTTEGQQLQAWDGENWRPIRAEIERDETGAGWTYRFGLLKTTRLRVFITEFSSARTAVGELRIFPEPATAECSGGKSSKRMPCVWPRMILAAMAAVRWSSEARTTAGANDGFVYGNIKWRVDSQTGAIAPHGTCANGITTTALPQGGIEGFKLQKSRDRQSMMATPAGRRICPPVV